MSMLAFSAALMAVSTSTEPVIYVLADGGNDRNSGSTPTAPLKSISRAQEVARLVCRYNATKVTIQLAGEFELPAPLKLWKSDSGQSWVGWAERGNATLSGGTKIMRDSWYRCGQGLLLWCASLPAGVPLNATSIFDQGFRRNRVRTPLMRWSEPLGGFPGSPFGFIYRTGDIPADWNLTRSSEWRAVAYHQWTMSYHSVVAVDRKASIIRFGEAAPYPYGRFVNNTASGKRWYLENVAELGLAPFTTQFRIHPNRTLVYAAQDGWSPDSVGPVVVPRLSELVSVENAEDIAFDGLGFAHTDIECPYRDYRKEKEKGGGTDVTCGQSGSPGMAGQLILARRVSKLMINNCSFILSGGDALVVSDSGEVAVTRSTTRHAGGGGILVDGSIKSGKNDTGMFECGNASVTQNYVIGAGEVVRNSPGIELRSSPCAAALHNEVANVSHTRGIRWDSPADAGAYTRIERNLIHHCGCGGDECLADGGGLDGASPFSRLPVYLSRNVIHSVAALNFGGAGIYCDVSSNSVQVTGNVVFDVGDQPFYWNVQPGGGYPLVRDAEPFRVVGNLFVKSRVDQRPTAPWVNSTAIVDWKGYTKSVFRSNIVAARLPPDDHLLAPSYIGGESCAQEFPGPATPNSTCTDDYLDNFNGSDWDRNLYWGLPASSFPAARKAGRSSFEDWQALGLDSHGMVADPLFRNPTDGDYRVQHRSPALPLGYLAWDWKAAGAVGPNWNLEV